VLQWQSKVIHKHLKSVDDDECCQKHFQISEKDGKSPLTALGLTVLHPNEI
jgi:hypothetical protein